MRNELTVIECGRYIFDHVWKFHRGYTPISIWYVNSGRARIRIDGTEMVLSGGHAYFFSHITSMEIIDYDNFDHTYYDFETVKLYPPSFFIELNTKRYGLNHLFEYGNEIVVGEQSIRDFNARVIVKYLETVLAHIELHCKIPVIRNKYVLEALDIIEKEYDRISVDEIAKRLNISKSYFIRIFKNETHMLPAKKIQLIRMHHGKRLLKEGMKVFEVSEMCGYSSPTSFCYAYRKVFGYPPSETARL